MPCADTNPPRYAARSRVRTGAPPPAPSRSSPSRSAPCQTAALGGKNPRAPRRAIKPAPDTHRRTAVTVRSAPLSIAPRRSAAACRHRTALLARAHRSNAAPTRVPAGAPRHPVPRAGRRFAESRAGRCAHYAPVASSGASCRPSVGSCTASTWRVSQPIGPQKPTTKVGTTPRFQPKTTRKRMIRLTAARRKRPQSGVNCSSWARPHGVTKSKSSGM